MLIKFANPIIAKRFLKEDPFQGNHPAYKNISKNLQKIQNMRSDRAMPFNVRLFVELRKKCEMSRPEFAKCLGLSPSYLFKVETGQEKPSLERIEMIASKTGLSLNRLIIPVNPEAVTDETLGLSTGPDTRRELNNKRALRLEQAAKILDMERSLVEAKMTCERYWAIIRLHERYAEIICDEGLSGIERKQKIKELAKTAAKEGGMKFSELLDVLRFKRSELKGVIGMAEYKCKMEEDISVEAMMPEGAALLLRCSVCAHREHGECVGYGGADSPLDVGDLVGMLTDSGFTTDEEHARIISEYYYGLPVTAHDVAEAMYRLRHGRPAQRGLMYLEPTQRKGK
jgi:transcriptional regulator with XRE-family HTH domain